jgi:hypothetical protein
MGAAALALTLVLQPARANDSVAHLAAGGLVLSRTDAVEMRSEDLFVSMQEIRVRYRFYNSSRDDVTTLVAFPLPDIRALSEENNYVVPLPEQATNFLGFTTTVDGKPVAMQVEQRALALDVDRTAMLARLGLPIAPHDPTLPDRLLRLPPAVQTELSELGMVRFEVGMGDVMPARAVPLWAARTVYYWKQTFPAMREVVVEHRYTPSVGGSAQTSVGADYESAEMRKEYAERYCVDAGFMRAARALEKRQAGKGAVVNEARLEYILTTGANWSGTIRDFRLTVDKGSPGNLVSFCANGVRKVSPTRFEVAQKDFYPQRNLDVLFLTQQPPW